MRKGLELHCFVSGRSEHRGKAVANRTPVVVVTHALHKLLTRRKRGVVARETIATGGLGLTVPPPLDPSPIQGAMTTIIIERTPERRLSSTRDESGQQPQTPYPLQHRSSLLDSFLSFFLPFFLFCFDLFMHWIFNSWARLYGRCRTRDRGQLFFLGLETSLRCHRWRTIGSFFHFSTIFFTPSTVDQVPILDGSTSFFCINFASICTYTFTGAYTRKGTDVTNNFAQRGKMRTKDEVRAGGGG